MHNHLSLLFSTCAAMEIHRRNQTVWFKVQKSADDTCSVSPFLHRASMLLPCQPAQKRMSKTSGWCRRDPKRPKSRRVPKKRKKIKRKKKVKNENAEHRWHSAKSMGLLLVTQPRWHRRYRRGTCVLPSWWKKRR